MHKSYTQCQLCGKEAQKWGTKKSYQLFQCRACKLIFVDPLPDPQSVYGQDYFSGATLGHGYVDYDRDKEPMIPTFEKYLDMFAALGAPSGRLFDVGAATGFFLGLARKRGYEVSGVEMSDYAAAVAREKGIDVKTGDMMNVDLPAEHFHIVTMLDVLEHMTDPFSELSRARNMLTAGGLLVINAPNGESVLSRLFKTRWHLVVPPEHLFYFSPKNLGKRLHNEGFDIVYSGTIGKRFTLSYIFKTLYKWQKLALWNRLAEIFSRGKLAHLHISLNLHDNFFLIARKHEK